MRSSGEASWVADTGRFGECMARGIFNEVETYSSALEVCVMTQVLTDVIKWKYDLPKVSK